MPGGWVGSARSLPRNWYAIRKVVLLRDGHQCCAVENGQRCLAEATDVDHIGDRDDHSTTNLRSLCGAHHRARTSRQGNAARTRPRALEVRPREKHPGIK